MYNNHSKSTHILIYIFLTLGILGLIDSLYLAYAYFTGTPLSCELINGCNEVAQSPYSHIAGVSLPMLGVIYYLFAVSNALLYLYTKSTYAATVLAFATTVGFLASAYFVYAQLFLIGAICMYCMFSAFSATILFLIGTFIRTHHLAYHDNYSLEQVSE